MVLFNSFIYCRKISKSYVMSRHYFDVAEPNRIVSDRIANFNPLQLTIAILAYLDTGQPMHRHKVKKFCSFSVKHNINYVDLKG